MNKCILIILLALIASNALGASVPEGAKLGDWSSASYLVWPTEKGTPGGGIRVPSPDEAHSAIIQEHILTVVTRQPGEKHSQSIYLYAIAEVGWASDSAALFLTRSDGGWVGSWFTRVILMKGREFGEIDISHQAAEDFHEHFSKCPKEQPNVIAITWVGGSRQLLLVAESPDHSSCPDMGNIAGYLVEVPSGEIIKRYNKKELRANYGSYFGPRLNFKYKDE
jgi:hypothetical protein